MDLQEEIPVQQKHTGNYAEIASIGCALADIKGTQEEITIYTDSQTAYFWITRGNIGIVKEREKIVAMANKIRIMISTLPQSVHIKTVRRENNLADPGYK